MSVMDEQDRQAIFTPSLEGFEGPLDLLLNLVRDSDFDLSKISVAELAEQYIAFLHDIPPEQLQRAAEYLLMAAWLAMLKSRLLLPPEQQDSEEEDPTTMAERLALQMRKLSAMQRVAECLKNQPQLGQAFFVRGGGQNVEFADNIEYNVDIASLLRVMGLVEERQAHQNSRLKVAQLPVMSIDDARKFLNDLMPQVQEWLPIQQLLPNQHHSSVYVSPENTGLFRKSCLASTLMAALEMQREGEIEMKQEHLHAAVQLRTVL